MQFNPRPTASPKRRRVAQKTVKDTDGLRQLAKPITVEAPGNKPKDMLRREVWALHDRIRAAVFHRNILPWELRSELEDQLSDEPSEYTVPPSDVTEAEVAAAQLEKQQELRALREIQISASLSAAKQRYEDAWGLEVVGPMLKLAFGPERVKAEHHQVVCELLASATISEDCVPRMRAQAAPSPALFASALASAAGPAWDKPPTAESSDSVSVMACSLSETRSSLSSEWESDRDSAVLDRHTRTGSKKVDFGVVVVPGKDTPLREAVQRAAFGGAQCSINQTTYSAVRYSPIAVSIELKRKLQTRDPVVQGGVWLAAWHRKWEAMRTAANAADRIITLPFIVVTEHQWEIFFLQDNGADMVGFFSPILRHVLTCSF